MKKYGLIAVALMALIVAGLFWLRGNLDGLVKDAIVSRGSAMTQAKVSVGAVEIRSSDGTGIIRDLSIANPAGFKTSHALKVAEIKVEIDVASLAREVVLIHKIEIEAPDVIYEKGDAMTNFDALQKNIASHLLPSGTKGAGAGKKLIVEEFTVRNAKAQASAAFMRGETVSLQLPDISLRNLGKARGGMLAGELAQEIALAFQQKLSAAISFDHLAKSAGQAMDKAGTAIRGLFGK